MKKYPVELTDEERASLQKLIRRGRRGETSARKVARARILLLADTALGQERSDADIVDALGASVRTVERVVRCS